MNQIRWGILGTGMIARKFAESLPESKTGVLSLTGSRGQDSADKFAAEFGGKGGSYADVVASSEVDAVYIALPHHLHEHWTIEAARAGKAILCEKPFTLDAPSAERALSVVKECGVFFAEAFMYRFHPQTSQVRKLLQEGRIGRVLHVSTVFGFAADHPWGNFRGVNAYGGGALMDVGCYCTSFILMVAGEEPSRVSYAYAPTPERYDRIGAGNMEFPSGLTADFRTAVHHNLGSLAEIWGEAGMIRLKAPWFGEGDIEIWNSKGTELAETLKQDEKCNPYALEADAVFDYLTVKEAPQMTLADSMAVMRTLDRLRESAGFVFDPIGDVQ